MKKIVIDNYTTFLCDDVIINILKRLPPKSVIRFQCVCKHWKNLINDPLFIADHLHHSTLQNPCLLFQSCSLKDPLTLHLLDYEMQVRRQVPSHPLIDYLTWDCVVDSSNGLLCVGVSKDGISHHSLLLCNPAIREVKQVPTDYTDFYGSLGFGFSQIVNDYKIVKIYVNVMVSGLVKKVEVYSLRTGLWKGVELGILDGTYICSAGFTANGAINWFGFKKLEEKEEDDENCYAVIISFDIAMEVFTLIPMPALAPGSHPQKLTTYENKLAILSYRRFESSESSLIDLWVMEEFAIASGKRYSWTKKYTSNPYPWLLFPTTVWRNEIVCSILSGREMEKDKPNIAFLNLTTKEITEFAVGRNFDHLIFNYVESLTSVGGMKLSAMFV